MVFKTERKTGVRSMHEYNKKMNVFTASVNEFCGNVRYDGATYVRYDNTSLRNASETATEEREQETVGNEGSRPCRKSSRGEIDESVSERVEARGGKRDARRILSSSFANKKCERAHRRAVKNLAE